METMPYDVEGAYSQMVGPDAPTNVKEIDGEEPNPSTLTSQVEGAPGLSEEVPKEDTPQPPETTVAKEVPESEMKQPEEPDIKVVEPTLPPTAAKTEAPPNEILELNATWRD